ncbi:type 2 lanthipeptide synthetase LanM family protein [Streptomyces virginiae]|uniref:type 2 lanthipeptide synthetase LanM family protein n=1 Tax=Streptomyces virginiae TaxID=1961 RepID=UPI0030E17ADD
MDMKTLRMMVQRTLALELNAARLEGRLDGPTPEARFDAFGESLLEPARALDFLADYPVLARGLVEHLQQWIHVRAEFAERFTADFGVLRERFALSGEGLQDVAGLSFGAGDAHRGGRTVAILDFRDGNRLVYKPRSFAVDTHVNRLLGWVNDRNPRHLLRPTRLLERPGYGWSAFIAAEPCTDSEALARFAWRLGAHLALFHVLGCYDMHLENLIAAGEHPAFIDLEALFHTEPASDADHDPVGALLRSSVLAVGLLPQRVVEVDEVGVRAMEISGMAGGAARDEFEIRPAAVLADGGTDRLRIARKRVPVGGTANRPILDGRPASPPAMRRDLIMGFEDCYRILLASRDDLCHELDIFADADVRTVLRNTSDYRVLLEESWHPDVLRDSLDRRYLFEALDPDAEGDAEVLASEIAQLGCGDVPVFCAKPASPALFDHSGLLADDYFRETGLEAARHRLENLSEEHLRDQLWFVHASLATREVGGHHQEPVRRGRTQCHQGTDSEIVLAAASRIGDRLLATVQRGADGVVEWANLNLVGEQYWVVGASGLGLYSGVTGIALFLAELASVTGTARYQHAARRVVEALADPDGIPDPEDLRGMPVGGFEDLCGVLMLLIRTGCLWKEPALLDVAQSLVPAISQNLEDDETFGVIGGAAGAALALISLNAARPHAQTVAAVHQAGQILVSRSRSPHGPPGFGYGAAGLAYALSAIADLTGDHRYTVAVSLALAEENSAATVGANAWCRGPAGTLLATARMGRRPGLAGLASVQRTLQSGVADDSLCHGALGLAEALRAAGETAGDPALVRGARQAAMAVAHRVLSGQVRTGVPHNLWVPGLMNGAAGIGYGLLRTALPVRAVPDILLLGT